MSDLLILLVFVVALLAAHELAHCVVARAHGYPLICVGFSPLAIGVVFLDEPLVGYWLLQVAIPLVVTTGVLYQGLGALPSLVGLIGVAIPGMLEWRVGLAVALAILTSSGDLASMYMEIRRPLRGNGRVVRDVRALRQIGSLVLFTKGGKRFLAEDFGQSPREFMRDLGLLESAGTSK